MNSYTEENYLKAIYHLSINGNESVSTNSIAAVMNTKAASVTDMLKKLFEKKLINYARYQGVSLTDEGKTIAVSIVRKHRLWEFFLVEKLQFKWDEVHDVAEELEHITSAELVDRLDKFLGFPKYDPHGDPIPDVNGRFNTNELKPISELLVNGGGIIMGVREHMPQFLQYLEKMKLTIGNHIKVIEVVEYDQSVIIQLNTEDTFGISRDVAKNILVRI
ncbi:MAG: metal-dependent transcriptional regulator [Mucilaginibacter sp.]|uniref:metal-dependent transcriptional regulator n=1 Tax=Mucilaginibacter sp. TaxID=1882438 RepID=UPI00326407EE